MDIGKDTGKCNKHFCNENIVPDNRLDLIIACNLLFSDLPFFIVQIHNHGHRTV